MKYGIFNKPIVTIYENDTCLKQCELGEISAISDEGLYGNTCKILAGPGGLDNAGNPMQDGMVQIVTSYGYYGFTHESGITFASEAKLRSWLHGKFALVSRAADVLSIPDVKGVPLVHLVRGNLVELMPERALESQNTTLPLRVVGWRRVRLLDERVGYIRETSLKEKMFTRSAVFYIDGNRTINQAVGMARGIEASQVVEDVIQKYYGGNQDLLREKVVETALTYLGTEYRWGGKTPDGIDCSGLVSASYMQNGILIYRDACIREGWPVKEIDRAALKPGDLMYFPGHVAMYIGQGRYVHSTGAANSGGVVINSLLPNDALYRQDLFDSLTACGSVF
ncbi:MAG: C40 family peptidase [Faecalibacterium sp.]